MNRLQRLNATLVKKTVPVFEIGDTVRVHVRVAEGEKERVQVFEGAVISRKGGQNAETFTVRKVSYGVGVERIFPLHSPVVERIDLVRQGRVRRAKLYYLRTKKGKTARVAEREYLTESKPKAEAASVAAEPEAVKAGVLGQRRRVTLEPDDVFECEAWARGFRRVAGVDEAGRGPLAGPVVAGAGILHRRYRLA